MDRVTFRVPGRFIDDVDEQIEAGVWPNRSEAFRAGIRSLPNVGNPTDEHGRTVADGGVQSDDPTGEGEDSDASTWTTRLYQALTARDDIPERCVMVSGKNNTAFVSSTPSATSAVIRALDELGADPTLRGGGQTTTFTVSEVNVRV